jgi:hypothetical protein
VQCPYFLVIVDLLEQLDIIELMEVPVRTLVKNNCISELHTPSR